MMDSLSTEHSKNALTAYLRLLRRNKPSLPHGQLVCVSAAPNITTMAGLLRLARTVGPSIAVLQIHADIIDDWSIEGVRRLTYLAKKFSFLIWEGSRVLNVQQRSGENQYMCSDEISREIDMSRKRYTRGVVSVAAWAGLVSTWVIGPEEQGKGGERLIPTLRRAAKETVALMTASVRTEISSGGDETPEEEGSDSNGITDYIDYGGKSAQLSLDDTADVIELAQPLRKASVISLTRTITQHTEPSTPTSVEVDDERISENEEEGQDLDDISAPHPILPDPPLLSRGVVICVPSEDDRRFTPQYKSTALSSAREHKDFVIGFVSDESWIDVYGRQSFHEVLRSYDRNTYREEEDYYDSDNDSNTHHAIHEPETLVVFSPLENDHITRPHGSHKNTTPSTYTSKESTSQGLTDLRLDTTAANRADNSRSGSSRPPRQITALHQLVGQALSVRDSLSLSAADNSDSTLGNGNSRQNDTEVIHIPVISLNV